MIFLLFSAHILPMEGNQQRTKDSKYIYHFILRTQNLSMLQMLVIILFKEI